MAGTSIRFQGNGNEFGGYLASSAMGKGPGVIVIQEWWGLNDQIKRTADRFAEAGFTALAPDFYHGKVTAEPDEAGSLMMALNIDDAALVIRGAIDALLAHESTSGDRVGTVGYCMGGQLSMFAAAIDPRVGACVNYYGIHPNVHPPFEALEAPVLGLFAEHDAYASPEAVGALSAQLTALGRAHEFHTYPGTQHAFANDDRAQVYDATAAEDAWSRTLALFRERLG